jgi:flagellar hook-associated protein FlgK
MVEVESIKRMITAFRMIDYINVIHPNGETNSLDDFLNQIEEMLKEYERLNGDQDDV